MNVSDKIPEYRSGETFSIVLICSLVMYTWMRSRSWRSSSRSRKRRILRGGAEEGRGVGIEGRKGMINLERG